MKQKEEVFQKDEMRLFGGDIDQHKSNINPLLWYYPRNFPLLLQETLTNTEAILILYYGTTLVIFLDCCRKQLRRMENLANHYKIL